MFFFNVDFYLFIFSHMLYYSNYIIIYLLFYFFLKKNDRFKKFIDFFWDTYCNEKQAAKNNLEYKLNSLHTLDINLQNRLNQYNLLLKKCEYIKKKKNTENDKQKELNYQKRYQIYLEECHKKILNNEKRFLIQKYTQEIILKKTEHFDDFFFVKQIEKIGNTKK